MEVYIFARFHARAGLERELEAVILESVRASRDEAGCRSIHAFRSTRKPRLFYIHSCFADEAAFELHAALPHTVRFLGRAEALVDHYLDVTRTTLVD
jgi:quinol monooxygenase YgiN